MQKRELVFSGVAASPGISIGSCFVFEEPSWHPEPRTISARKVDAEKKRFRTAVAAVRKDISRSHQTTFSQFGSDLAEVLEMQLAILDDQVFLEEIEAFIEKEHYDAAYAAYTVFSQKKDFFMGMSNAYFRERAFDIQHLKELLVKSMLGERFSGKIALKKPAIVIAHNLSPNDTIQLHLQKVLGFVTTMGGKTSHTAIVARALGVPAVVGVPRFSDQVKSGDQIILDGNHGEVILHPEPETIADYKKRQEKQRAAKARLLKESSLETRTQDGHKIAVRSNIEFENELPQLLKVSADGIGLFRTEGLFLNRSDLPSEEEQTEVYRRIAEAVYPNKLVLRTLDIGGDKILPQLAGEPEENPFLGWRAIRFWLDHREGFQSQLKAALRANTRGNIQILLPMVSGLSELRQAREVLDGARETLRKEGKPFVGEVDLGIMIEIPSAVILADQFAREADFFSIGTNDLVQYTLAVDRGNERVANLYSHFHPAVLRMIKMTLDAGRAAGIPVGMCGEMAGDPLAIPLLLGMGFQELSLSHSLIPEIKKIVRDLAVDECQELYGDVFGENSTQRVVDILTAFFRHRFPEIEVEP